MTLNDEIALILRYFTEFGSFRGVKVVDKATIINNLRLLCLVVNVCRGTARRPGYKYSITARWKFCSRFINSRLNAHAVRAQLSSNLLNEVGYLFGILKYVCDIIVKKVHVRYLIS